MRCLRRNKEKIYYANFVESEELIDEWGNKTGEYRVERTLPIPLNTHVSPSVGESDVRGFGTNVDYDRVVVCDDPNLDIQESSVLWIGVDPTTEKHNYIVKKVAPSMNFTTLAIKKVEVS